MKNNLNKVFPLRIGEYETTINNIQSDIDTSKSFNEENFKMMLNGKRLGMKGKQG
ncbi:hypothetical protein [Niallia circulans]|uniref:hypothetical protein n=1 Tax=Niallia circulans TaxID=1397 RepID=UPI0015960922|nr:hypothetical protein [Niallia circulans]